MGFAPLTPCKPMSHLETISAVESYRNRNEIVIYRPALKP